MRGKPACPVLRGLRRGNAPELPDQIYFSVIERKVVSPNDFTNLDQVEQRLAHFEQRYNATARPFRWKFTRPISTTCSPGSTSTSSRAPHVPSPRPRDQPPTDFRC